MLLVNGINVNRINHWTDKTFSNIKYLKTILEEHLKRTKEKKHFRKKNILSDHEVRESQQPVGVALQLIKANVWLE